MKIVFLCFSFFLDGILSNFLSFLPNTLSFCTPLLTLVFLVVIFPLYKKNKKKYFLTAGILGFCYDLFYTNLLFFNACLFVEIAYLTTIFCKRIPLNYGTLPILLILLIGIYHLSTIFFLHLFQVLNPTLGDFFYLWTHTIFLNVLMGEIFYFIFCFCHKKYVKAL